MRLAEHLGAAPWRHGANSGGLTELEVATGVVVDIERPFFSTPSAALDAGNPRVALEAIARDLLASPPCVVAFSGGRDSSALLAVLLNVARREGLPEPIATTMRFDGDAASDEREWQEHVVDAIGVRDWEIVKPGDDFDLLGPTSTRTLVQHGLLWPAPAYSLVPLLRAARGGALVTGEGGDDIFLHWPYRWAWPRGGRRFHARDLAALVGGFGPRYLREQLYRRRLDPYQEWLRPDARRVHAAAIAREAANESPRWTRHLDALRAHRSMRLLLQTFSLLAASESTRYAAPFADPAYHGALGAAAPYRGFGTRSEAMIWLFGDLLPHRILTRASKASFGAVFWGPASRDFAQQWDGRGVDPDLVDPARLRAAWMAEVPVYGGALPLHAAWLATHAATP